MAVTVRPPRFWLHYGLAALVVVGATALASGHPVYAVAILALLVLLLTASHRLDVAAAVLGAVALCLMRPGLFGERYSPIADGAAVVAALLAFAADRGARGRDPGARALRPLLGFSAVLWIWIGVAIALGNLPGGTYGRGLLNVPVVIAALWVVLKSPGRRILVARVFVAVLLALSASYVATVLYWAVRGQGTGLIGSPPWGYRTPSGQQSGVNLYFPFTPTSGAQSFGGLILPRFLGLGREPGIHAAYSLWALMMLRRLGWNRPWSYALLLVGLIGTLSTAGFGVLAVIIVVAFFLVPRGPFRPDVIVKHEIGLVLLAGAAWLAYSAPVLGVADKVNINEASVSDRQVATLDGLRALTHHWWGMPYDPSLTNASINVIASAVQIGTVGVALVIALWWVTWARSAQRAESFSAVLALFLSTLLSQPFLDSTAFYVLLGIAACSVGQSELALSRSRSSRETCYAAV